MTSTATVLSLCRSFQAAHEWIFRAMDANKDGRLTLEEIQDFIQGVRRPVQRP